MCLLIWKCLLLDELIIGRQILRLLRLLLQRSRADLRASTLQRSALPRYTEIAERVSRVAKVLLFGQRRL